MEKRRIDLTACACIVYDNKILMMHHTKLDLWLFPGGHIDNNETPDKAVSRECMEEAELDIKFLEFSPLVKHPEEIKKLAIPFHTNLHSVGDHDHYGIYYLCGVDHPNFVRNDESKDMRWFSAEDLEGLDKLLPSIKQMALHALKKFESVTVYD